MRQTSRTQHASEVDLKNVSQHSCENCSSKDYSGLPRDTAHFRLEIKLWQSLDCRHDDRDFCRHVSDAAFAGLQLR